MLARAAADGALLLLLLLPLVVVITDRPLISGHAPFVLPESRPFQWGGRDFTTKREFRSFLTARGATYETWVKRHPGVAEWPRGARPRDVFAAWILGAVLLYLRSFGGGRRSRKSYGKSRLRVQRSPSVPARRHAQPGAALPARREPMGPPVTAPRPPPPPEAAAARDKHEQAVSGSRRESPSVALARGIAAFASGVREKGEDLG